MNVFPIVAPVIDHDEHACRVAQAVAQVDGVKQVILFGSRARGDHRSDSDLDLLVVYESCRSSSDIVHPCRQVAKRASEGAYDHHVSIDIVPLAADHFAFMQHGLNHVAAHAAREGITPIGHRYRSPSEPGEPSLPEHRRRESMEQVLHARRHLTTLEILCNANPDHYSQPEEWEVSVGEYAQGALEHGLKAVIAAFGHRYLHIHPLGKLLEEAQKHVPDLSLLSNLDALSTFACGEVYGTPGLEVGADELLESVRQDVGTLFSLCAAQADFDPWMVGKSDFQRGA
ncbi:MAG: HEPN domain-containing protein [Caldilineaceae bacterium SB0666_bin_21]|nr:HEPN domain-containing protein [Caldilineaceae bacterium SB0666_bin_21]